jgi:hypothetical protein
MVTGIVPTVTTAQESTRPMPVALSATRRQIAGAEGNERLIAWTGASLLAGFAAEGVTILFGVHAHLAYHIAVGFALFLPVGLKVCTTTYRFARYYTNSPAYRLKGPPQIILRVIGPFLVLSTLAVLLTGVAIMFGGQYRHYLEALHKLSFLAWFGLTSIHVLAYVWRLPKLLLSDLLVRQTARGAAAQRIVLVLGAGLLGLGLAAALMPWIRTWVAA